ncbi:MAG: MBL fold metallo-hydrolase [Longimicrobiales bacterium]
MTPRTWAPALTVCAGLAVVFTSQCTPTETVEPQLEIEYIGHASFLLRSPEGAEVLVDPYASRVWIGYDFPTGLEPDAVVITHPHYDHDAGRYRGADFPWPDATVVDSPGVVEVGDIRINGIEGKHADPYGMEFGQLNTLMVLEVAGIRLLHVGDNGPISADALAQVGSVDILMMPMDSAYHILSPEETEQMRQDVPHRLLIPMHYRLHDLEPDPETPEDLGPIEPVLRGESRVRRVGSHMVRLGRSDLPESPEILVFDHSPMLTLGGVQP